MSNFDPSDWVPSDIFGTKKKLAGERKPIFPEGVPGLERGVPAELMRDPSAPGSDLQDVRRPAQRTEHNKRDQHDHETGHDEQQPLEHSESAPPLSFWDIRNHVSAIEYGTTSLDSQT